MLTIQTKILFVYRMNNRNSILQFLTSKESQRIRKIADLLLPKSIFHYIDGGYIVLYNEKLSIDLANMTYDV